MNDHVKMADFLRDVPNWRILSDGACVFYRTGSLAESAKFVSALGELPELADRSLGIDIRNDGVTVRTVTVRDDIFGLTQADTAAALAISAAAEALGLEADPSRIQSVLIVPGAPNRSEVMPFWQAVMGYEPRPDSPDEDLVDPSDRGPAIWTEEMEEARPGGLGAIHIAVWLPIENGQQRVDEALAAGGRMVRDDYAPAWWTLADAYGNEVDVATVAYRDEPPPSA